VSPRARHLRSVPDGETSADQLLAMAGEPEYGFIPRGMRREAAAYYVGVSPAKFDDWVSRGIMPGPKKQDGVVCWDRRKLDRAYDALPDRDEPDANPFKD
jgi:hypothetical protein